MVVLTEQIEIPASYEKLKAWTANFEEEFVKWSPYHIECNLYNRNYHAGSKVRFREIVMGLDYDVTGTITECEQDENHFRIVFRSDKKTAFITFEGKRTETGCHFSHTEAFGMTTPVIGAIMNFLIFKVFFRKKANWQLIRDDMILDNRYLYDILTAVSYTHLDVYKRQVLIFGGAVRAIRAPDPLFLCAEDSHNLAVNLGNFAGSFHTHHALSVLRSPAVSYTHLDVYKRQALPCTFQPEGNRGRSGTYLLVSSRD